MTKATQLPMIQPECPVLGTHNAVRIEAGPKPDKVYWCTGCGAADLKAPDKKVWE